MKRAFVVLSALLVAASVAWAAQTIEGKIMTVDPSGKMVTLHDGTILMIPPDVKVKHDALKNGVTVIAVYVEQGGQKVVNSIEVHPEEESQRLHSPGAPELPKDYPWPAPL
jgi:Cu/Ag efflux protein CusF